MNCQQINARFLSIIFNSLQYDKCYVQLYIDVYVMSVNTFIYWDDIHNYNMGLRHSSKPKQKKS